MATIQPLTGSTNDLVAAAPNPDTTFMGTPPPPGTQAAPRGEYTVGGWNLPVGTTRDKYGNYVGPDGKVIANAEGKFITQPGTTQGWRSGDPTVLPTGDGALSLGDIGRAAGSIIPGPLGDTIGNTAGTIIDKVTGKVLGTGGTGSGGTGSSTAGVLLNAINNSKDLQNQYNQPINPLTAPTAQASLIGPVERAGTQAPITPQQIQAAQIAAYQAAQGVAPIQAGVATAGQSTAGRIDSTALARQQAAINAERVGATLAASPERIASERISSVQAQQQAAINAERVSAAQAGRTVLGPTALADETFLGPTAYADQTNIDAAQQAEFREGQVGLVSGLEGAISGKDPSVAAIMLRQQTDRNIANQFALAQSARGGNVGFAQRNAAINAANIGQNMAGQQALLRAQEIATARGQLGGVLSSGRESDIGLATSQAQLAQQVNLANAGFTNTANMTQAQLSQAVKLANAGFKNTANTTQAQLDQATMALNTTQMNSVNLANASNSLDASKTNASLAQQVQLANQAAEMSARTQNANNALDAAKSNLVAAQQTALANQSAQNVAALENAKNALIAAQKNADLAQSAELANQAAINTTSAKNAEMANTTGIANAGNITSASQATANNQTSAANTTASLNAAINQTNATNQSNVNTNQAKLTQEASTSNAANDLKAQETTSAQAQQVALANALAANTAATNNAKMQTDVSQSNATNQVSTNAQNITQAQNAASNTLEAAKTQEAAAAQQASLDTSVKNNQATNDTNLITGLIPKPPAAPAGGGSDRRVKKDIRRGDADISKLLASIKSYGFRYKDPKAPGAAEGQRFGVMAQDLEKSKAGKSLVSNTPHGKMVDTNQAILTALAALGNVNKRLKKVEGRT